MNPYEQLRYERQKSRPEVSDETGVHIDAIRRLEEGRVAKPTAKVAEPLARYYGMTVGEFLALASAEQTA